MKLMMKMAWVETKLFIREPLAMIFTFAFPFFMLIVLAGVFGNDVDPTDEENLRVWRGVGPTDFYAPAYVGLVIASIGLIALPLRLATYRERGVLRRFRAAGLPLSAVIGSQVVVAAGLVAIGAAGIAVAARAIYGALLPESWPQVLAAFVMGVACFSAIGVALGALLPTARAAQGLGLILFFVMMMIGGAGPPREVLAEPMQWFGNSMPLTYVVLTLQTPWLGYGWDWTPSIVVVGATVVASAVAFRFFRWE